MGVFKVNCVNFGEYCSVMYKKNVAFTESRFNYPCVCATVKGVRITHLLSSIMKHNG